MSLHLQNPIPPITPESAGWRFLSFRWGPFSAPVSANTGDRELAIVVIAGRILVQAGSALIEAGTGRRTVFDGMPEAVYLPPGTAYTVEAVGATFADVVTVDRFVTDLTDQDALNRVWGEYFGNAKPTTTTVQVVRLATDPRCLVEITAIAVID